MSSYFRQSFEYEPIRMFLKSNAAAPGSTRGLATFPLNRSIAIPNEVVGMVSLLDVQIANSQYNINSSNNVLIFEMPDAHGLQIQCVATIPIGNYTAISLRDGLNTQIALDANLQANAFSLNVVYNQLTNTYTFSSDNYPFTLMHTSTILNILGFDFVDNFSDHVGGIFTKTSTRLADLSGNNSFYIGSNLALSNMGFVSGPGKCDNNILARVQFTSEPGSMEFFFNNTQFKNKFYNRILSNITIQLYDENMVPWVPMTDWSMVLEFTFYEQFSDTNKTLNRNSHLMTLKSS